MEDDSPDSRDRVEDFLARHGGAGTTPARAGKSGSGDQGWSEVYAADGYALRCEWSRVGSKAEMQFTETPPATPS